MSLPDSRFLDGGVNGPHENTPSAWGANYVTLRNRWPRVAEAIAAASIDECASMSGAPYPALAFQGKQVVSAYDPAAEALDQAEGLEGAEAVYCYGIGMGYLPGILAMRHEHVFVVLPNLSIARAALEVVEMPWLSSPNVTVQLASELSTLFTPYACVPVECFNADAQGHALRDRLISDLNQRAQNDLFLRPRQRQDMEHLDANAAHMKADIHVGSLFLKARGETFVIVGAGPSLDGEMEWLRSQKRIVCTTSVLRVLLAAGVRPEFAVIVDADKANTAQLDGVDLERTREITLVYYPAVAPRFVASWRGPRVFFGGELYNGGTVMHCCADLAVQMGAAEVVMVGLDFCFPNMKSHAEGTPDYREVTSRPTLAETVNGHGEKVMTGRNLAMYHRNLEWFIAKHPEVKWRKRGRAGVSVAGASWD